MRASAATPAGRTSVGNSRLWLAVSLAISTGLCIGLVIFRYAATGVPAFHFLIWNLFLAVIPFPMAWSAEAITRQPGHWRGAGAIALGVVWLIFLPNAPYLVTDLVHLGRTGGAPLWFDALLYGCFAVTGVLLCHCSLALIHIAVLRRFGTMAGWLTAVAALSASAFGVYLGRVERWNSWNVVDTPGALFRSVVEPIMDPLANPKTIGYTLIFGAFLIVGYGVLFTMSRVMADLTAPQSHRQRSTVAPTPFDRRYT
jgi:uncharacterized membrane protein